MQSDRQETSPRGGGHGHGGGHGSNRAKPYTPPDTPPSGEDERLFEEEKVLNNHLECVKQEA